MSKTIRHRQRYAVRAYLFPFIWYTAGRFSRREDAVEWAREGERYNDIKCKVVDTFNRRERKAADSHD